MDDDSNNTAKWMEIISAFDKGSIHRKCSTNEDLVFAIALLVLTGKKISPFEFITRTLIMDSSHIQLKNQSKFKDIFFKTIYSGEMLLSFNMARPPHIFALTNSFEAFKHYLTNSYDIMPLDQFDENPLHYAIKKSKTKMALFLLNTLMENDGHNAIYQRNKQFQTPLHLAAIHNNCEVLKFYIKNYPRSLAVRTIAGLTPLHCSIVAKTVAASLLLAPIRDSHIYRDYEGHTPLMLAVQHDNFHMVNYYLAHHPTMLNATKYNDETAFHHACRLHRTEITKLLLKAHHNYPPKNANIKRFTPIMLSGFLPNRKVNDFSKMLLQHEEEYPGSILP